MVGDVVKAKLGELEDEVREGLYSRMSKELNSVVKGVYGKSMLLVRFKYGVENDMDSNKLIIMKLYQRPVTKEAKVTTISAIPDEKADLEKIYYHGVYVL